MRVAVFVVLMSVLPTPSEASKSCMTKTEARQHFDTSHIYWHGAGHCWDATPPHRSHQVHKTQKIHKAQKKTDEPKWRKSMSEMRPDEEPAQAPLVERWVNIEPPQLPIIERWVDIVQVAPPPIVERKIEPTVTPRGVIFVIIAIAMTVAIVVVLFGGIIYQRTTSRRNTRWAG